MGRYCKRAEEIRKVGALEVVTGMVFNPGYGGEYTAERWIVAKDDPRPGNSKHALCFTNRVVVLNLQGKFRFRYAEGNPTVRAVFHEDYWTPKGTLYDVFVLGDGKVIRLCHLPSKTEMQILEAGATLEEVATLEPVFEIPKSHAGPTTLADVSKYAKTAQVVSRIGGVLLVLFTAAAMLQ